MVRFQIRILCSVASSEGCSENISDNSAENGHSGLDELARKSEYSSVEEYKDDR